MTDLPRSNNAIEGWHNAFASRVLISHPSVSKLADKIRREQSKFEIDIKQVTSPNQKKQHIASLMIESSDLLQHMTINNLVQYLNGLAASVTL